MQAQLMITVKWIKPTVAVRCASARHGQELVLRPLPLSPTAQM
jgi:hypothetical protein